MTLLKAQVIIPYFTGIPEDVMVNQFHFLWDDSDSFSTAAANISTKLEAFYDDVYGAASTRVNYVDWANASIKVFNMGEPPPRIPWENNWNLLAPGTLTTAIPTEVACCLSWQAAPESGIPYQSLYNRVYLGGISTAYFFVSSSSNFPVFSTTFMTQVGDAASTLLAANTSLTQWVQYGKDGIGFAARDITGGWVDNSPDTQRRRSVVATTRSTWS